MAWWQYALLALVIAWALQAYGVWVQTQHYQRVFAELRRSWSDGMLGVGAAPAKLGKGAIVIVVVDPRGTVRAVEVMQGRSVFAKFKSRDDLVGLSLADLKARVRALTSTQASAAQLVRRSNRLRKSEPKMGARRARLRTPHSDWPDLVGTLIAGAVNG